MSELSEISNEPLKVFKNAIASLLKDIEETEEHPPWLARIKGNLYSLYCTYMAMRSYEEKGISDNFIQGALYLRSCVVNEMMVDLNSGESTHPGLHNRFCTRLYDLYEFIRGIWPNADRDVQILFDSRDVELSDFGVPYR
jgi:hypothetical protein